MTAVNGGGYTAEAAVFALDEFVFIAAIALVRHVVAKWWLLVIRDSGFLRAMSMEMLVSPYWHRSKSPPVCQ